MKKEKALERRFWELITQTNSIKLDKEKYPNSTFGFINDKLLWEYDSISGILWLSYRLIWSVFEKEFNLNYDDIQAFIKIQVEEHFKCKQVIPCNNGKPRFRRVEEHFKCY